jgi:pimeloyl-ACP methyl ester carboxylesterase
MPRIDAPAGPQAGWAILDRMQFKTAIWRATLAIGVAAAVLIVLVVFPLLRFANDSLKSRYPPPGTMVSIGTHRLHVYCEGRGAPVVIIEPGIGSGWETWGSAVAGLTRFSRVCVYDRSGYGWSEPRLDGVTASVAAGEFHSVLVNAPVPGPYILVAHSFGAYIARIYADRFRSELLGLVLVDPSHEDEARLHSLKRTVHGLIPPSGLPGLAPFVEGEHALPPVLIEAPSAFQNRFLVGLSYNQAVAVRHELASLDASEAEVRAARFPRDVPLTVITATHIVTTDRIGQPEMPNPPRHFELQASLAKLSSRGRQIVVKSGHQVQMERPDLIVSSVRQLIDCCTAPLAAVGRP